MAGAETRRGAVALILLLATACASSHKGAGSAPGPALPPPRAAEPAPAPASPPAPTQAADQPVDPNRGKPGDDPTLIVIDPATDASVAPKTISEAAAEEKARRARLADQAPKIVITDKNLASYAAGGVLTIAHPVPGQPEPGAATPEDAAEQQQAAKEAYWRKRGLEIRQRWHDAVEKAKALQTKVEELRTRFYATDDPAVRDGQVKPDWDRALADLEQARYEAARGPAEVERYLEEGRRAGALPGWLREGVDLEPEQVIPSVEEGDTTEPRDPEIYQENQPEPSSQEPPPAGMRR